MTDLAMTLRSWCETNSGTDNLPGVAAVRDAVVDYLRPVADDVRVIELPPRPVVDERGEVTARPVAAAAVLTRRADAERRVLLCGHCDTVFAQDSPFQQVTDLGDGRWNGPGAADMKGGLLVMAESLRRFEAESPTLGWTVVLNTDEEVGSPSSTALLKELAPGHAAGLVFEPALADGRLAGARGGSANFDLVIRGRGAHVGREFHLGRSAVHVAGEVIGLLAGLNAAQGVTVNVGRVDGGGPSNRVAEVAVVRFNVRVADDEKQQGIENDLRRLTFVLGRRDGITAGLHGAFFSPPKPMTPATSDLFARVRSCGESLGIPVEWTATGGVCDGNKLQAAGLPTVDTLGVRGGGLHTEGEFVVLDSIEERVGLTLAVLRSL